MSISHVALLGLGIMGSGMAHNLLKAGYSLTVYNRTRSRCDPFAARGAQVADTPAQAVQGAHLVFSMVGDDTASRAMWLGDHGALRGAAQGTLLVETSTLSLAWTQELAALAAAQGCDFLDAPVTGSKPQANEGKLRLFVGGASSVIERARPVLESVSAEINHMGPVGHGAMMKLINNMMAAVHLATAAEALALAERAGMDTSKFLDVLLNGAAASPITKGKMPRMQHQDYDEVHFALRWMRKDVSYALQLGEYFEGALPIAAVARELFQMAYHLGYADADIAALIEVFRQKPTA